MKLSYVNNGKKFELPIMTVEKQEKIMERMAKLEKDKITPDVKNREINKYLVLLALKEVDTDFTESKLKKMHPDDLIVLSKLIWDEGRELELDGGNFRESKKKI